MASDQLKQIFRDLSQALDRLSFGPPVTHVYNPLVYARDPVEKYLDLAARQGVEAMFLGMNPGPWGMAQTGVPFGTIGMARDWLGIEGQVEKPALEHPKRPITGFETEREEVSGTRFWGWAKDHYETPQAFFDQFFVANFCPLVFMEETGRNRTPDKLPAAERKALFALCDQALRRTIEVVQPRRIIGIGKFAEDRAKAVAGDMDLPIARILHPSPASPIANRGWAPQAEKQLAAILGDNAS